MSLKLHLLDSHLDFFNDKLADVSDEHGERFHQDIAVIERRLRRYKGTKLLKKCWQIFVGQFRGINQVKNINEMLLREKNKDGLEMYLNLFFCRIFYFACLYLQCVVVVQLLSNEFLCLFRMEYMFAESQFLGKIEKCI